MTSPSYPLDAQHAPELGGGPILDAATFGALADLAGDDDPDLISDLVGLFLEDSRTRVDAIRIGLDGGDAQAIGAAAHALKSSGANIGALAFSRACAELEKLVRTSDEVDAAAMEALVLRAIGLHAEVVDALSSDPT